MFAVLFRGSPLKDAEGNVLVFPTKADAQAAAKDYTGTSLVPCVIWNGILTFVFEPQEEFASE